MIKYNCRAPFCHKLVDIKGDYCADHKGLQQATIKPFENAERSNDSLYHSARWRKLRQEVLLRDDSKCLICGNIEALQVHHIIEPRGNESLFFDKQNCITVCLKCHRKITAKEIQERKINPISPK